MSDTRDAVPALSIAGLTRRHGATAVVDSVHLDVAPHELVALVGPSGCGKSTLLRMVAGLERVDAGTVALAGRDVTTTPPERRRIGLVFQDHALFGHLRVEQNVAFGLRRWSRRDRARRVAELLDVVRLGHAARRYPHELSGGEQQRIALVRALAPNPDVVLLDEPFANLDESLRDEVRRDVVSALAAQGTAAVLVTHDRDEALMLGDRVAVMRQGRLLQVGRPEEVYEHPVDRFVAGFLAVTSFLPARGAEGGAARTAAGGGSDDGAVLVARPHDLAVVPGTAAVVVERTYLGAALRYTVRRADGTSVIADGDPAGTHVFEVGDTCDVEVVATHPLHRVR